jgi:UDP-glucose 4-epimerase
MILVTGGAGYIGSHFVHSYLKQYPDEQLVVIDNLSEGHHESLPKSDRVVFYNEDVGNSERLGKILTDHSVKAVVHFASSCYVGESQKDPPKYFHNNAINGLLLFETMERAGVKRFVLSSTCATYGIPTKLPIDETHFQNPINVYGLTKLMLEKALAAYSANRGWSYVSLRYFNAAGASDDATIGESHDPETHIIPLALQTAMGKREAVEIYGDDYETEDGTCIRDYIHVNDLSEAHWQALELTKTAGFSDAINLGTTHGASVREIIDVCERVSGRKIKTIMAPRRSGDPPRLVADNRKAARVLGWQPRYDLEAIIRTAWNWEQHRRF